MINCLVSSFSLSQRMLSWSSSYMFSGAHVKGFLGVELVGELVGDSIGTFLDFIK